MTSNVPNHPGSPGGPHGPHGPDGPDGEPHYIVEEQPPDAPVYSTYRDADYRAAQYPAIAAHPPAPYPGQGWHQSDVQYPAQNYPPYPAYRAPFYYGGGGPNFYPGSYPPVAPPPARPSKLRRALLGVGAAIVAVGLVLSGVAIAQSRQNSSGTVAAPPGVSNGNGGANAGGPGSGNQAILPNGPGGTGGTAGNGTSASASVASKQQQVGIVTVVSVLSYASAESAGTGMVLSPDGEILTNNHVINGATSITVTVESTGRSYRADVVGTAPTKDVAVLKLRNASGLATARVATKADVAVGDAVTGVGNAGGTGTLRAAVGKVTALGQSITATDESGQNPEKLTGLIETDAGIVAGDSGGPLYASDGTVVGMDTAASANTRSANAYAIPIGTATSIAAQITSGAASSVIHIGLPAFIGVTVLPTTTAGGAIVQGVVAGDPADRVGITAGSLITGVGSTRVTTPAQLKQALGTYRPGQSVKLTWTDTSGQTQSGNATLVEGPAD